MHAASGNALQRSSVINIVTELFFVSLKSNAFELRSKVLITVDHIRLFKHAKININLAFFLSESYPE